MVFYDFPMVSLWFTMHPSQVSLDLLGLGGALHVGVEVHHGYFSLVICYTLLLKMVIEILGLSIKDGDLHRKNIGKH